jgi:hypothetical protein
MLLIAMSIKRRQVESYGRLNQCDCRSVVPLARLSAVLPGKVNVRLKLAVQR